MSIASLIRLVACSLILGALAPTVWADSLDAALIGIEHGWAHVAYEVPAAEQDAAYTALEAKASALAGQYPQRAEPKVWQAIILSTHAGEHGGLGALGMAKKARDLLVEAEHIDPDVLHGSIYTTLGSLYYEVPGWPLGFGNKDKARAMLQKALQLNPDGIDPNYFYGDFLYRSGDKPAARAALEKALAAPPRADQPLADEGRRRQIRKLIQKIDSTH
jgi:Tfp pilus assembly protein PilF